MNAVLASLALFAVVDIEGIFSSKEAWEVKAEDFAAAHLDDGFVFASQKRDIVNSLKRGSAVWMGREVWETRLYYAPDGGPKQIEMSLYNNGDRQSGDMFLQGQLDRLVSEIQSKYGEGAKTVPKPVKTKLKSGGFRYESVWTKCDPSIELTWGVGEEKLDGIQYVRVTLSPRKKERPKGATKSVSGQVSAAKVKANVKKNAEGDVWIDGVPMVDQGQKGYCAAAVSERILRYYGHDIDEHEIAQQAGSQAQGGTKVSEMIETIRSVGVKKRLGFNQIVSMAGSVNDIQKDVDLYNRAAKSLKEPEISIAEHTRGNTIMAGEIFDEMKPNVLKKMSAKDSRFKKFISGVKTQVDKGVPICWGVTLGLFPEPGVSMQSNGGHMRMIIGYNTKTREILYTDTWGAGHELKRMPEDQAFAITHDAFFLRPL